ncbi:Tat binding protein 1-interacting protein-domain-containing protein [Sporodiniella umbellata]|nr:Tat binding protein 1-interacting protein-domain-containing protein [Sporodiniella umbellata]
MAKKKSGESQTNYGEEEVDVLDYMNKCNRPYSATDVFNNLHTVYSKLRVTKALDKLVEEGALMSKLYGKTSIYSPKQEIIEHRESLLETSNQQIDGLTSSLSLLKAETQASEEVLSKLKTEVTTEDATELIKYYKEQNSALDTKLKELKGGITLVSAEKRKRVDEELTFNRYLWKKRCNLFKTIFSTVNENMPGDVKALKEELAIQEDEVSFHQDPLA